MATTFAPGTVARLASVNPRMIWQDEARDFTPWLASNLERLGEALGLDLELISRESAVGPFSCDLEAKDVGTGRRVIVENQLERTDHSHLGQLLTYAAGLDASVIVWISPEVRDEHRKAIDFLNSHTRDTVDFFAIELKVLRIGDSAPAAEFRLAASPNAWGRSLGQNTEDSPRGRLYRSFFQTVLDDLRTKHKFTNARAAQAQSWYTFTTGVRGFSYGGSFTGQRSLRAELYIDLQDMPRNKQVFDYFYADRGALERAAGEPLTWERLDARRACRIAFVRPDSPVEGSAAHAEELRRWLVDHLLKLKAVFGSRLAAAADLGERTLGGEEDGEV